MGKDNANLFRFLTYNLFLPLVIPFIILIGINVITENVINLGTGLTILQSLSLFLIVSFFTNIGFWSYKSKETTEYPHKENYVAASLILGVLSVFLFISSTLDLSQNHFVVLLVIALVLLVTSLNFYYKNPLILHSNPKVEKEKGAKKDEFLGGNILKKLEVENE